MPKIPFPSSFLFSDCSPPLSPMSLLPSLPLLSLPPYPFLLVIVLPSLPLPLHGGSFHLHPFLASDPSFPLPFISIHFSFSSSSSSKPIHEHSPFTATLSTSVPFRWPPILLPPLLHHLFLLLIVLLFQALPRALPLHDGSLYLRPFLAGDPSFPRIPFSSSPQSHPSPPPLIPSFSSSFFFSNHNIFLFLFLSSSNLIYEVKEGLPMRNGWRWRWREPPWRERGKRREKDDEEKRVRKGEEGKEKGGGIWAVEEGSDQRRGRRKEEGGGGEGYFGHFIPFR